MSKTINIHSERSLSSYWMSMTIMKTLLWQNYTSTGLLQRGSSEQSALRGVKDHSSSCLLKYHAPFEAAFTGLAILSTIAVYPMGITFFQISPAGVNHQWFLVNAQIITTLHDYVTQNYLNHR